MLETEKPTFKIPDPTLEESFDILYKKEMSELTQKYTTIYATSLIGRLDAHAKLIEEGKITEEDELVRLDASYFILKKELEPFNNEHKERYKKVMLKLKNKFFNKDPLAYCSLAFTLLSTTLPDDMTLGEWAVKCLDLNYDIKELNDIFNRLKQVSTKEKD